MYLRIFFFAVFIASTAILLINNNYSLVSAQSSTTTTTDPSTTTTSSSTTTTTDPTTSTSTTTTTDPTTTSTTTTTTDPTTTTTSSSTTTTTDPTTTTTTSSTTTDPTSTTSTTTTTDPTTTTSTTTTTEPTTTSTTTTTTTTLPPRPKTNTSTKSKSSTDTISETNSVSNSSSLSESMSRDDSASKTATNVSSPSQSMNESISKSLTKSISKSPSDVKTQTTSPSSEITDTISSSKNISGSATSTKTWSNSSEKTTSTSVSSAKTASPSRTHSDKRTITNGTSSASITAVESESRTKSLNGTATQEETPTKATLSESISADVSDSRSISKNSSSSREITSTKGTMTESGTVKKTSSTSISDSISDSLSSSRTADESRSVSDSISDSLSISKTAEESRSVSDSISDSLSISKTADESRSISVTAADTSSFSRSRPPTSSISKTESLSLSKSGWSKIRVTNPIPISNISALGVRIMSSFLPSAANSNFENLPPLFEIEGARQLQINGSEWLPARKVWPSEFDIPRSQQKTRTCRVLIQSASVISSSSSGSSVLPPGCPAVAASTLDKSYFRILTSTDVVPAAFGQCSFDSLTVDWIPSIFSCLAKEAISTRTDSTYRTPVVNITLRFCANTTGLSSPIQPLPRKNEICQDHWTIMSSCPVSRENVLYSIDNPSVRLVDSNNNNNNVVNRVNWNVEGTWFKPNQRHECRMTDNAGTEIFSEPASSWVDFCRIVCSINQTRLNQLQNQVTLINAASFLVNTSNNNNSKSNNSEVPFNPYSGNFLIENSISTPGFAGHLTLVRDGYLFTSSCPGLSIAVVAQLNQDTTKTSATGPSCQFIVSNYQQKIFPLNSLEEDKRNGCPIRLIGRPITPTFFPASGTILAPVVLASNDGEASSSSPPPPSSSNNNNVLAVLQQELQVAFCDLAGNRAHLEDALVGPRTSTSVSILGQHSPTQINISSFGTEFDFRNATFVPVTSKDFDFSSSSSANRCPHVEDIPLLFEPKEYFGWFNHSVLDPFGQQPQSTVISPQLTYCVKYDADIPTDLKILNDADILLVGDTDVGMPVSPIVSATNRVGKIIEGNIERFQLRLKAEVLQATDANGISGAGYFVFDQFLKQLPITIPIPFNTTGTGFGLRITMWSNRVNQSSSTATPSSTAILFGTQYPWQKNISVSYCPFTGNPPPFVIRVVAQYNQRTLCGSTMPKTLIDGIYQFNSSSSGNNNNNATSMVTIETGSIPYTTPVFCQFSNVDAPWTFTAAGWPAQVVSSCQVICAIPQQRFPIRALSAFAFNASGNWVSSRTLTSPPGMMRLKVDSSWIGPISMDVLGPAASIVLLSFTQTVYIRLQKTVISPITVSIADATTNALAGNDDAIRTVYLSADEGTSVFLNGTQSLQGSSETCNNISSAIITPQVQNINNGVATIQNILFVNPQAGDYTLRVTSPRLSSVSVSFTLRNPDPNFHHYLRFGGKTPPLDFTDPSSEGTNFGKFPIPLSVEACVRGTQVPDSEVSGFSIFIRVIPMDTNEIFDTARGIGLGGCDSNFGNCAVSERGVVTFDQFRFFGTAGKYYKLVIAMSNASLDVDPLFFTVHTPNCDVTSANAVIVAPNRMRLSSDYNNNIINSNGADGSSSSSSSTSTSTSTTSSDGGIDVRGRYFPIPDASYTGWVNQSNINGISSNDRYQCTFAGATFPARFIDSCTIRCFVNDFLFFARRRLINGSDSRSAATSPDTASFYDNGGMTGDAKRENSTWMIAASNMTLPPNITLCDSNDNTLNNNNVICCFNVTSMSIVCSRPVSGLLRVLIPDKFLTQAEASAYDPMAFLAGQGTLYVVGAAKSAHISQPDISATNRIFGTDQIVPVNATSAEARVAPFDLVIVDSIDQPLLNFDTTTHRVFLKSISRRGKPVLSLPANWSAVLESTMPSPFVKQNLPGNCLEKIPGSIELFKGDESLNAKVIFERPTTTSDVSSSTTTSIILLTTTTTSTTSSTTSENNTSIDNSSSETSSTTTTIETMITVSSSTSSPSDTTPTTTITSSSPSPPPPQQQQKVPIVKNITGIQDQGWITQNGSLRIESLKLHSPAAGTYDFVFSVEIESGNFVDTSFSLHVVGGEPTEICLWTFGGEGMRNPIGSVIQPQPMFMFLDAAGNIYQPLRQNPNLTSHLNLIDETFVRSTKEIPFLMFRPKSTLDGGPGIDYFQYEVLQKHLLDPAATTTTMMITNINSSSSTTTSSSTSTTTSTTVFVSSTTEFSNVSESNTSTLPPATNQDQVLILPSDYASAMALATNRYSSLSFEIPELEFIEPQGVGLLTYMFRSFQVTSNFSFDFKIDFRATTHLDIPSYWKNSFNKSIMTPVFESADCPETDYAVSDTSGCRPCPSGTSACIGSIFPFCFICNGTTTSLVEQSYWRFSPESTVAYYCSKSTCLGPSILGTCDAKTVPKSPLCQVCAPGFAKALDGGCSDCGEQWVSVVIVVGTTIVVGIVVGALVTASLRAHEASSSSSVVLLSKIFVNFLQVLGMLGEFGVGFPGFVKATLMGVSIGSGAAGIGLNPVYCLFPEFTFLHVLVLHLVLPVIVLLVLAGVLLLRGWLVTRRYRQREEAKRIREEQIASALEKDRQLMNLHDFADDVDGAAHHDENGEHHHLHHHLRRGGGLTMNTFVNINLMDRAEDFNHDENNYKRENSLEQEMKTQNNFTPVENNNDNESTTGEEKQKSPSANEAAAASAVAINTNNNNSTLSPDPISPINPQEITDEIAKTKTPPLVIQPEDNKPGNDEKKPSVFSSFKGFFTKNKKDANQEAQEQESNDEEDDDAELGPPPQLFQGRIFLTSAIIVMFLLYQSILTQTIETFRCDHVVTTSELPEISYMMADPRVPCVGRGYEEIIALSAWGLFLYGLFVPLSSLVAILHTARTHGWSQANDVFAFLINGFRLECWYWELVIVFRKVVIRVLLAVIDDDMLQALLGVWFLTGMFIVHAYRAPYVKTLHNNAESLSLLTTIMVLNFGMLLQRTQEMTQEICGLTCNILSLVLVIVLSLIVFFFAANIVRAFYDHLIEVLGVDRPDGRKVIVWRNVVREVGKLLGREDQLPANFADYTPSVLEPHIAEMLGTDISYSSPKKKKENK